MELLTKDIEDLRPHPHNSRIHSETQIQLIINSIERVGYVNPIIIDEHSTILAGHGRLLALKTMGGLSKIPCVILRGLTELDKRVYVLADNQSALKAEWDDSTLLAELDFVGAEGVDLETLGFEGLELSEELGNPLEPEEKSSTTTKKCPHCDGLL